MPSQHQLGFSTRRPHCRRREPQFLPITARKDELAPRQGHAVQFPRIIQAEQSALPPAAGGEFRQHRGQVSPHTLDAAGGVQFRKEANDHALSLPSTAQERKTPMQERSFSRQVP
jgi:hypothetical protein